ncbi:TATA element modulatory factor isoform X2 [Anthonomus grandis grandis]|uniref:TATA element modulatory factor isoform X2 n=1 Tax=Anthonomus grandis grandis TaxID=2921223 RepID=UPI00216626ED|nr:TATA element modulatory factor isoform X2 [Anthonomus grandis grandis]
MSWFDAGALANIAKSALKEAQKTIDKALDIKEDSENIAPTNTPIDTNPDDFFGTWGITQSGHISDPKKDVFNEDSKQGKTGASIWGSFTGSFFNDNATPKNTHSHSIESLDDSIDLNSERNFSKSKLVVDHSEEEHLEDEGEKIEEKSVVTEVLVDSLVEVDLKETLCPTPQSEVTIRKIADKQPVTNRLSVVSSEGSKNNSESIDILTGSTECTTTPESDFGLSPSTSSSAQGLKVMSESVEILGDSLTSPSSVEIIGSDSTNSRRESQHTDGFASPLESPCVEEVLSTSIEKLSPESVEVIPEEQEENSVAEDTMSYTSLSESTSATVLDSAFNIHNVKPQKMLKDTYNRPEFSDTITSETGSISPDKSFGVTEAITRAPVRSMHLPLQQVSHASPGLIDTQPQSSKQDLQKMLETTNIIDIPQEDDASKSSGSETLLDTSTDDGSTSDRTLVETQENAMETSSDTTSITTETSSNSAYLKKMLADAMTEKSSEKTNKSPEASDKASSLDSFAISSHIEVIHRENSPLSSEKSDLVKIGSDHTSCHTSCDELETTTSSDIEIISSPNGDSSSTQSRQSPAKKTGYKNKTEESTVDSLLQKITIKKVKGHNRELSEASSISDDSHPNGDIERLLKRVAEMTEILESRETKLIDMNRRNAELQEQNSDLKMQLDCVLTQQLESADVSQVTEEYTRRLSALEKKFQQAIREKDSLRKQLDQAKLDVAARLSKNELESAISEKDEIIKELREEGEKLSKTQLQHSNIIKKLRAKEKENETIIKNLKEMNESLSSETERLKKSLSAKEDVERTQIEAVHNLTTKNKKLDTEVSKLKSQLEDLTQKFDTTKKSLEAAKKELVDKNKTSSELLARQQLLESLENEKRMTESQNEEVINQLDDLRHQLSKTEEYFIKKEQKLKQENRDLLRRLEEAENRNEELSQAEMEITKPLVRQLESLQATYNMKISSFNKIEQELSLKISDLQTKLQASSSLERSAKEECISMRSKLADLEGQLNTAKHELEMTRMLLEQTKTGSQKIEQELRTRVKTLESAKNEEIQKLNDLVRDKEKEIQNLRQQLTANVQTRLVESVIKTESPGAGDRSSPNNGSNSPTLSLGKVSVSESLTGSFWSQDEPFEVGHTSRYTNMFEMQMLQSNLKQKEGELQQLQWELNRREHERSLLNGEISTLINRVEELEKVTKEHEKLKEEFSKVQQEYETLCQLYGEKVEENEELKQDLLDVKEIYKSQLDELLRQQREKQ